MKLGTLKGSSRDGELVVVSRDGKTAVKAGTVAVNLQQALEDWDNVAPKLELLYKELNENNSAAAFDVDEEAFHSPLPRAYQWADGSAFIHHIILVRKARNAEPPKTLNEIPLMYQGGSDDFLAPREDIPQVDPAHGTDFEGEVGVITADVPMGVSASEALKYIRLFVMINDVSLRGLIPAELAQGFGFLQSKPSSAFAPFAISVDELGEAWKDGRIHLPLDVEYNGAFFGKANAGSMHFHFGDLIAHAAKTRNLKAGTLIGSGTVSEDKEGVGSSCLAEKRMIEKIETGNFETPFMSVGDTIKIEMLNAKGENLFGTIFQKVVKA